MKEVPKRKSGRGPIVVGVATMEDGKKVPLVRFASGSYYMITPKGWRRVDNVQTAEETP